MRPGFTLLFGAGYGVGGALIGSYFEKEQITKVIGGVGCFFAMFSKGLEGTYDSFVDGMIAGALLSLHMVINKTYTIKYNS